MGGIIVIVTVITRSCCNSSTNRNVIEITIVNVIVTGIAVIRVVTGKRIVMAIEVEFRQECKF